MTDILQSKYVFIDTSMYESKNFQFHHHLLGRFTELCEERSIYLLMSIMVDGEVISHLTSKAHEAAAKIREFKKTIKILRNLPEIKHYGIFEELSKDEAKKRLLEKYEEYKEAAVFGWIDIDLAKPSIVAAHYFGKTPPFSDKKKDEFPDALMLLSILEWAKNTNEKIYILSNDSDMKNFCDISDGYLLYEQDLDKYIELVINNDERLKDVTSLADDRFSAHKPEIEERLEECLSSIEYSSVGDTCDGDVTDAKAYDLEITDKSIIKATSEFIEYSVSVQFIIEAWHRIPDYDRSIWDSEDKRYIFVAETSKKMRDTVHCNAYVSISVDDGLAHKTNLDDAYIEDSYIELDSESGELLDYIEHELFDEEY